MKYLHLGIIFGLHEIDLVLSFLGFRGLLDQLLELPVGGVFILSMLQFPFQHELQWYLTHNRPSNDAQQT